MILGPQTPMISYCTKLEQAVFVVSSLRLSPKDFLANLLENFKENEFQSNSKITVKPSKFSFPNYSERHLQRACHSITGKNKRGSDPSLDNPQKNLKTSDIPSTITSPVTPPVPLNSDPSLIEKSVLETPSKKSETPVLELLPTSAPPDSLPKDGLSPPNPPLLAPNGSPVPSTSSGTPPPTSTLDATRGLNESHKLTKQTEQDHMEFSSRKVAPKRSSSNRDAPINTSNPFSSLDVSDNEES